MRQQKWNSTGGPLLAKNVSYDPFDRTSWQTETVTTQPAVSTRYVYLGLDDQAAVEEQTNTAGAYEVSKAFTYGPDGDKLALIDTPVNGTTTKKSFYGVNPHGDVDSLTDSTGHTTSTYRYTAYGSPDKVGTTGDDAITGDPVKDADIVNPYRFNGKRLDGASGTYDMGFREYDPSLNRFLTRDLYDGALRDMAIGADPWNANRYAFGGGNPIGHIELDGHCAIDEGEARCGMEANRTLGSGDVPRTGQPVTNAAPHPDRYLEMSGCNGGPGCVMPDGYAGKYGEYRPIPGEEEFGEALLFAIPLPVPTKLVALARAAKVARQLARGERVVEETATAANRAADMVAAARASGKIGASRNIAAITLDAGGKELSGVAVSGQASRAGMIGSVGEAGNLQRFVSTATGNNSRFYDSEFKLLNYAANQLGRSSDIGGTLRLHSEIPICTSCSSVIAQFERAYPNIKIIVTTG